MRKLFSLVIAVGLLAVASDFAIFSSLELTDETITHSREIDAMFRHAADYVEEWNVPFFCSASRPVVYSPGWCTVRLGIG